MELFSLGWLAVVKPHSRLTWMVDASSAVAGWLLGELGHAPLQQLGWYSTAQQQLKQQCEVNTVFSLKIKT